MNFKEEYTELQNNIIPDAAFLEQLAVKMEQEKIRRRRKPRLVLISAATFCTSAAAALIVIFSLPKPGPAPVKTNTNNKFSYITGIFTNKDHFSADRSIPEQLAQMLSESETVLYKSDENKFDRDGIQDEDRRIALSEKIRYAREIDSATESTPVKRADHYMMVLENGDVLKFSISGDVLAVNDKFYKIP
ncbi:MAG: hypothetical protein K2N56_06440 [Oscillospiraceae bacterium]|nr:hypothetical protein [Oscillospiraceae bacterium]